MDLTVDHGKITTRNAENRNAERQNAECRNAEYRNAEKISIQVFGILVVLTITIRNTENWNAESIPVVVLFFRSVDTGQELVNSNFGKWGTDS